MKKIRTTIAMLVLLAFHLILPVTTSAKQLVPANEEIVTSQSITSNMNRNVIADNIFNSVELFNSSGQKISTNDTIPNMSGFKMNLEFLFDGKNYQKGDTFSTILPEQINITKDLSGDFSPMETAKWQIDSATNTLTITFIEDNVSDAKYELSLTTSLKQVNTVDEETQKLIFDTLKNKTIYNLEITSVIDAAKSSSTIESDNFNPTSAQITNIYNLDRSNANDRVFILEGYLYNSNKMTLDDVKVYSNDVDFNGALSGAKTLLKHDVDYTIDYVNQNSSQPSLKVTMKNSLNKKAIIVDATLTNLNGTNYINKANASNEYNYLYAYARTQVNDSIIASSNNSKSFVVAQPLAAKGEKNKDTGYIDWSIEYNFNEQPLTTLSSLTSLIEDTGVEYVPGSLQIIKVDLNYINQNDYEVVEKDSGINDFTTNMENNGSFDMNYKKSSNQAYIIKYSTQITDTSERVIENVITNNVQTVKPAISLIPNLLHKESGLIDLYNQTMEWTVTINQEKAKLKNAIVHDYFIDQVVDYTELEINKKVSDTELVPLLLNVDYIVERFDENGAPLGVTATVNGAPESFNGGIRIKFINNYATIQDTIAIKINTKIDSNKETAIIKNKATLNANDVPGVIEYEASGSYENPYYQGGAKLGSTTSSDSQYLYQNWLVLVNSKGNSYTDIDFEDVIPDGLELVPNSLRYEEVTSKAMIDNIIRYLSIDYNLLTPTDDAYPTSSSTTNNTIKLKFNNLDTKRVYVKYKTRVAKDWLLSKSYTNIAKVNFDGDKHEFKSTLSVYNYEPALQKSVTINNTSENVADWSVLTKGINQYLKVENPIIKDELTQNGTNATYDSTSFIVTDTSTNERISSSFYDLDVTKTNFTITFKNYTASSNIKVTYRTISEYPGLIRNSSTIESSSYGLLQLYYRSASTSIALSFTSGSGTGVLQTGGFSIKKVDTDDTSKLLPGAIFEIYTTSNEATGLKAKTNDEGIATFHNLPYGKYIVKEIVAPDEYEISDASRAGRTVTINSEPDVHNITITNSLAPTLGNVELTKIDDVSKKALSGAIFKIVDKDNKIIAKNLRTDNKGKLLYNNILSGDYKFIETSAPTNYKLDTTPLDFNIAIKDTGVTKVTMTNTKLATGKVIVNHIDTSNNKIAKSITQTGVIDSVYKTNKLKINGYTFKYIKIPKTNTKTQSTKSIGSGKYKKQDQVINYVYEKNIIDHTNNGKLPISGNTSVTLILLSAITLVSGLYIKKRRSI